jgi:hypothetical protein
LSFQGVAGAPSASEGKRSIDFGGFASFFEEKNEYFINKGLKK